VRLVISALGPFQCRVRFQTIEDVLASNSSDDRSEFDPQRLFTSGALSLVRIRNGIAHMREFAYNPPVPAQAREGAR